MNNIKSAINILKKLNYILTDKQKKASIVVFLSMVVCSLLDLLGVSIIYPFLQMMLDVDSLDSKWYLSWLYKINPNIGAVTVIIIFGLFISIIYLVKNLIAMFCYYLQINYSAKLNRQLSTRILDSYMKRPYEFFVNTHSSILIRGLNGDVNAVYNTILNCFQMFADFLSIILIIFYILKIDVFMAGLSVIIAGICFVVTTFGFKGIMQRTGKKIRVVQAKQSGFVYQSIMGIKEITVLGRREAFVRKYEDLSKEVQKCTVINGFVSAAPNRILEGVSMAGIMGVLCLRIAQGVDITVFIPTLGAFAVGVFRIMPSVAKISGRVNSIVFFKPGLDNTYDNLVEAEKNEHEKKVKDAKLDAELRLVTKDIGTRFRNELVVDHINWRYQGNEKDVLKELSIDIKKGESVAFIGKSGGGKSTLADVLMTLFQPQSGTVKMDGIDVFLLREKWLEQIGYVPQNIFMMSGTIRENIAFGLSDNEISDDKIWSSLEQAQLKDFVEKLPHGLDEVVGENGIKFSGGQRQRIAIARALYDDPQILIMDEATAALDGDTEKALMEAVDALHGTKTLILIAHRLTTVKNCDKIYEIKDGKAVQRDKKDILSSI